MLWIQDYNGDQAPIVGYEIQVTETLESFDALSFIFLVDPNDSSDLNYVASNMIIPRSVITEPETGKKFRILQPTCVSVGDKLQYTVTCTSVAYDLHANYVESTLTGTQTLTACLNLITSGTDFSYEISGTFANYEFSETFGGAYADDLLSNLASDFDFEYYFDNYKIYIKSTIGTSGTFLFVDNQNASKIQRQEDYSTITTYIKGYGKENDSDSDSSTTTYSTTAEYTSPAKSIYGLIDAEPYSSDSITQYDTLLAKLKEEIHDYPDVQYTMSYTDFINSVQGFTNDFTPGNYGWLRDRFGTDISVRVQSVSWYPQEQDNAQTGSITFGNAIFDPNIYINKMRKAYKNNVSIGKTLTSSISSISSKIATTNETLSDVSNSAETLANDVATLQQQIQDLQNSDGTWASGNIFIDVSKWQTDTSVTWFTKCVSAGAKGIMVKLSDGSSTVNALASTQLTNSASAGLTLVGCYHYLEEPANASAEATNFLAQLQSNNISKDKIVALDIEADALNTAKSDLNSDITTFLNVLTNAGYTNTCIYASKDSFSTNFDGSLAKYKWIASWDASSVPSGASAWQYTDNFNSLNVDASKSYSQAFV